MSGVGRDIVGEKGSIEKEEGVLRRWKNKAKGKPIRWRMIRDVVACLSLAWMSTSQIQIAMRRLWALKNSTTRDLLEELEQEKAVIQAESPQGGFKWGSTRSGLAFWVGLTKDIPASTAQVASTSAFVNTLEE